MRCFLSEFLKRRVRNMDLDEAGRPKLSEDAEKELTRLWRTWKTVNEMLLDRV